MIWRPTESREKRAETTLIQDDSCFSQFFPPSRTANKKNLVKTFDAKYIHSVQRKIWYRNYEKKTKSFNVNLSIRDIPGETYVERIARLDTRTFGLIR
jgi:hypothetical protein